MILEGIQDVAGSQYPRVLTQAGLTRYLHALPAADQTPTITEPELSALYGTTYGIVGESLTRLFLSKYGQRLPEALLASPAGQEMLAKMEKVPRAEKLKAAVHLIAETGSRLWTEMFATEDAEAFYLEIPRCAICANIRGTRAPICANSEVVYGALARALTGIRITALEVECAATGAARCKYRLRK